MLLALLWLNFALMLGYRNQCLGRVTPSRCPPLWAACWPGFSCAWWLTDEAEWGRTFMELAEHAPGIALVSDMSLGLFLTMALMGLRLWELQPVLAFITAAMLAQIALVIASFC